MIDDEGDGNGLSRTGKKYLNVMQWGSIARGKLVTLLFLLDNGDKTTGGTERSRQLNATAAYEARNAFYAALKDESGKCSRVVEVLRTRLKKLVEYPLITLGGASPEVMDKAVRRDDEDLLTLVQACRYLGIPLSDLQEKASKVQHKFDLTPKEMEGDFFLYAENLRMTHLCDALTPLLVDKLFQLVCNDSSLGKLLDVNVAVSVERLTKTDGLKEALFYYLIRSLELEDKCNRIYTDKLQNLLHKLSKETNNGEEKRLIEEQANRLGQYPLECRPVGHCVVFCVTRGRRGAEGEMRKITHVFQDLLGYTIHIEVNPNLKTMETFPRSLERAKFKYYDSIVFWFMSHGSEDLLKLADGNHISRKNLIDSFSKVDNFRKKPKIFFMAACQGKDTIAVKHKDGLRVAVDGVQQGETFSIIPEWCHNITAVYYQMDRLVASATLPQQLAFRLPDGGSVFVDAVCRLLQQHQGVNLTQVLERVSNKMHQILFASEDKFQGEAKQACYYETTFQKTFLVPSSHELQDLKK